MRGWLRRLPRVLTAAALVFLVLAAGTRLYAARAVDAPAATALEALPFVIEAEIASDGPGARRVQVMLDAVPHLREAFLEVERTAQAALGSAPVLVIQDRRDDALLAAFYRLRPYVLEAAETGRYSAMAAAFAAEAAALGLHPDSGFTVDADRLYVQLHRDDAYLYAVEPRPAAGGGSGEG